MGATFNETYFFPRSKKRTAVTPRQFAVVAQEVVGRLGRPTYTLIHGELEMPFCRYSDLGTLLEGLDEDERPAGLTRRYEGPSIQKLIAKLDGIDHSADDVVTCAEGFDESMGFFEFDSVPLLLFRLSSPRSFEVHNGPQLEDEYPWAEIDGTETEEVESQCFVVALASGAFDAAKKIKQVLRPYLGNTRDVHVYLH